MRKIFERINNYGLVAKIFLVMFFSILTITITITFSTLKMSEKLFTETFSITNSKILRQIQDSVEVFNYSVVNTMNHLERSRTVKKFMTETDANAIAMSETYYNMGVQMKMIRAYLDTYDTGITVVGLNGQDFSTNRVYWSVPEPLLKDHPITKHALAYPTRLSYHYDAQYVGEVKNPAIVAAKALTDKVSGEVYGVAYIAMKEFDFRQFYTRYTSTGNDVVIVNSEGIVVSSNLGDLIGQENQKLLNHAKEIEQRQMTYKTIKFKNRNRLLLAEYLPELDLYMVNLIDRKLVMANLIDKQSIVLTSALIVGIATLFIYAISRRLTKSLTDLVEQIDNIVKYNFNHNVTVTGSYETKQVATAFNFMLDELHEYIQAFIVTQKKQRNAELAALQQQINPHFLYNTLASIKIIVTQGDREKAAEMINKLIALLQNTIGNISETNTVEQELINMQNYTFINQARYGDKIKVNYYIAPDCLAFELPKLIIQPFIENAFFHAFNQKTEGIIRVMIGREGDYLVCEVVDNGDGMETSGDTKLPNYKSKRQLFSGIGVKNVNDRIKLLYGKAYGVEITSEIGKGTKIKIRLPINKSVENTKI